MCELTGRCLSGGVEKLHARAVDEGGAGDWEACVSCLLMRKSHIPREASLLDQTYGSALEGYLPLRQDGGNIPPAWIDRAKESRKNREKVLAKVLKANSLDALALLRDWELAYRKECFYHGIRALMELQRSGKTNL